MKGLVRYLPELEREIFVFQRAAYPHRDPSLVEPRWKWMFIEPARRLGLDPLVWMYRRKDEIVAHQGAIGVEFQLDGKKFTTGWFVETMALESVRGKAIGPMVIQKALEDLPFNLSLGQTETMRNVQFALGWEQVAPLRTYVLPLRPVRVLKGKMNNLATRFAAAQMLSWRQRMKRWTYQRAQAGVTHRMVERFGAEHDSLWRRLANEFRCCVVRDAEFLNWKFVDQPGVDTLRFEVLRGNTPEAAFVFTIREPDNDYRYRRAVVLDLLAPPGDRSVLRAVFDAMRSECVKRDVDLVSFDILHAGLEAEVIRYGFIPREAERVLLLSTRTLADSEKEVIMNPGHWLLTRADSDIDRPW
ncbi:MAG: hypothetical protein KDA42_06625 [Planctomycetales bacterium]|nr:hypothetical protein [Planctomycetales bacterium]